MTIVKRPSGVVATLPGPLPTLILAITVGVGLIFVSSTLTEFSPELTMYVYDVGG